MLMHALTQEAPKIFDNSDLDIELDVDMDKNAYRHELLNKFIVYIPSLNLILAAVYANISASKAQVPKIDQTLCNQLKIFKGWNNLDNATILAWMDLNYMTRLDKW